MKIGLIGLFCCILGLTSSFAQGKVLIITRDTNGFKYGYPQRFESSLPLLQEALQKHYQGNVVTHAGLLPDSLEQFDAVFTDLRFVEDDDSVLIASETNKLSAYLQAKGNLYIEVSDESTRQFPTDSTFNELVGLPKFGYASGVLKGVDEVIGIKGQFTDGLYCKRNTNPAEDNALYLLFLDGNVEEVLRARGGSADQSIAWKHQNNKQKVVYHWLIVQEHYEEFIGKVICNYFGLCEPLDVTPSQKVKRRISFDPLSKTINVENVSPSASVELYTVLGVKLLDTQAGSGVVRMSDLPRGSYFVVVREGTQVMIAPLIR